MGAASRGSVQVGRVRASCVQVVKVLSGLTRALSTCGQREPHVALLQIYREAWPRLATAPTAFSAHDACTCEHLQLLLTGSADAYVPPARYAEFLYSAAQGSGLQPGMRLFFVVGATLAGTAQDGAQLGDGPGSGEAVDATALRVKYLQSHLATETLRMPYHLRGRLLEVLCLAQQQVLPDEARAAVQQLSTDAMLACSDLLTHAPPVLMPSQLCVGHVLAQDDGRRRAVVAARLALDASGKAHTYSSYAHGVTLTIDAQGTEAATHAEHLCVSITLEGASEGRQQNVAVALGVAADTEQAVSALVSRSQRFCSGEKARVRSRPRLWVTLGTSEVDLIGDEQWTCVFRAAECASLEYELADQDEVVVFAACEWPAPGAAAPVAEVEV